jgi:hypothetical protein
VTVSRAHLEARRGRIPLGLILGVDLPLCVVANVADLGEAPDVELGSTELRHDGDDGLERCSRWNW